MRSLKSIFVSTVVAWMIATFAFVPALAQTSPNWSRGYVPTAAEWNALWASKQDYLGSPPLLTVGGTMTGALITSGSTTVRAGINLPQGTAPTTPNNGDMWMTTAGLFVRVNGTTVGPLISSTTGAVTSVSNVDGTLTISPTTGAVVASLALAKANTWTGVQTISLNSGALQAAQTGTVFRLASANAAATRLELNAFGAQAFFTTLCAGGTAASPTKITSGTQCGGYNMFAYDGTAFAGPAATFRTFANQDWAVGAHGSYAEVATTPNGSTTLTSSIRFEASGGVTIPSTVTGGDKGAGTINATTIYQAGTALATVATTGSAADLSTGTLPSARITGTYSGLTGTGTLTAGATGAGFTVALSTSTLTGAIALANLPAIASNTILSNITGGAAVPAANTMTSLLDIIGATRGSILYRGAAGWAILTPGVDGTVLTAKGVGADPVYTSVSGTGTVTSVTVAAGTNIAVSGTCAITTSGTCTVAFSPDVIAREAAGRLTPHENLVITYASASTVTVTADALVLFDSSGNATRLTSFNVTPAITASGAAGLDTGSEAASTWYAVWAVATDGGTKSVIFSASFTSPTMPATYTKKGLIGAVYNNASSNFIQFYQRGNSVGQIEQVACTACTGSTYQTLSLAAYVPPNARLVTVTGGLFAAGGTTEMTGVVAPDGTAGTQTNLYGTSRFGGTTSFADTKGAYAAVGKMVLTTPQQIKYYIFDGATGFGRIYVYVVGYDF